MKKIKVSEATNLQLDWLISRLKGYTRDAGTAPTEALAFCARHAQGLKHWSSSYQLMGPIIERELLSPDPLLDTNCCLIRWRCRNWKGDGSDYYGHTSLIAAARCYIVSKLGEEVEVPDELC